MANNTYRIDDFTLLKTSETYKVKTFWKHENQYILAETPFDAEYPESDRVVWDSGKFKHRVNRIYNEILFQPTDDECLVIQNNTTQCDVYLKQGFNFSGLFGIHFIAKDMTTEEILISKIMFQNDFIVSDSKELINGSFWIQKISFDIPRTNNNICVQATRLRFEDVDMTEDNLGYLYLYPNEFIPLIGEKPTPDFIKTKIEFDENHWITVTPYSTENKLLQQSILDYFGLQIADIKISHVIKYGNVDLWYKTIRISNEDNTFMSVNVGLNLSEFLTEQAINPDMNIVTIFVSTEIEVDSKLMKRETSINTDLYDTINPIVRTLIKNPETVYPINVTEITQTTNTIIEQNVHTRIVPINQPVFVRFIDDAIKLQKTHISFNGVTEPCMMIIEKTKKDEVQIITSKVTSDGILFFDLSEIFLNEPSTYILRTMNGERIIGNGNITI